MAENSNKDEHILHEAMEAFEIDRDYWKEEYLRAEDDIDFSLGNQWPDEIKAQRQADGRPCLTENRIDVSIIQTVNDIRQTRPSINVSPQDDKADIETARVLKGIIKNIEQQSNANNAYDTAAENAIRGGYGWIRVNTQYVDDLSFDQEATIEAVENPFSVLIDSNSRKLDGSDMRHGFVFIDIPREQFEDQYPDADPVSFETDLYSKEWCDKDTIRVAEYFYKDETPVTIYNTPYGVLTKKEADELGLTDLEQYPKRESKTSIIKWCKFTAKEILEKTEWIGRYIPIVPVYGKVVWNEGRRKSFSLTYQGKDPQRRYNFHITAETEYTALQPKAPWVAAEGQLEGYEDKWNSSNIKNHAVLEYRPMDYNGNLLPAPQRQAPPSGSPAMMQQALVAADGIKATLGIFDASLGNRGNETSGKAILARQAEGDNATFHFVDNLATSIRQVGRILVDIIPKLYSGATIARILGEDGSSDQVPLNQPVRKDGKGFAPDPMGQYQIRFDTGRYDVSVDVGPSYATRRQEAVQSMLEVARADPRILEVAGDLLFKSMDWPFAQEIGDRIKRLMPPTDEENPEQQQLMQAQQAMQQMGQQLMQMEAALKEKQDNQAFSNELELKKIEAQNSIDQQKLEIEREKLALETLKAQAELTPEQVRMMLTVIAEMDGKLQDVTEAVSLILDEAEKLQPMAPAAPEAVAIPMGE